jgi:hypothetical protein
MEKNLSKRELEVLSLLLKGINQLQIAKKLDVNLRSVSGAIDRIKKKWMINSIIELGVEACRRGIDPQSSASGVQPQLQSVISKIVSIPNELRKAKSGSIQELLNKTNYSKVASIIDEFNIKFELLRCPKHIHYWIELSDHVDTSGWYISKIENGNYLVGTDFGLLNADAFEYGNIESACAFYIKRVIEHLRLT